MAADEKARKEANDEAAGGYVTRMLSGNVQGIVQEIANDPHLTWETKRSLGEAAQKQTGQDDTATYGPGFWSAYKAVTASPSDPSRIADPSELLKRAGPGGDLTLAGVQKLSQTLKENQRSVSDAAVNQAKVGLLAYAKSKLSFDQESMFPGMKPLSDPKGAQVFNAQFIPKFEAAYDQWTKAGKDPWQFLTQDTVDRLKQGMRPEREMAMDRIAAVDSATPGVNNPAAQPLPPAPAGIDPGAWTRVVAAPPPQETGVLFSSYAWARAVRMLSADPTPQNMKAFDESQFGRGGASAEDVLKRLKPVGTPLRF